MADCRIIGGRGARLLMSLRKRRELQDEDFLPQNQDLKNQESQDLLLPKDKEKPFTKQGKNGSKVQLSCNYIRLNVSGGIYEYSVEFSPPVDHIWLKHQCLKKHEEILGPTRLFNGVHLLLAKQLPDTVLKSSNGNQQEVTLKFVQKKSPSDPDCVRLYNLLLSRIFKVLQLCPIGAGAKGKSKSYFDPINKHVFAKYKLEVWPGYVAAIEQFDGGVFLQLDSSSKVVRSETVLDILADCYKRNSQSFQEVALKRLLGRGIITRYNNKTYRVDNVDFDLCPEDTFTDEHGNTRTFVEYYKDHYDLDIKDTKQPLLVNHVKRSGLESPTIKICLVPELCFVTGLTDSQKADYRMMKEVAQVTRLDPSARQQVVQKFVQNVLDNPNALAHFQAWGLDLCPTPFVLQGRLLGPETLHFGQGQQLILQGSEWGKSLKSVLCPVSLTKWAVLYTCSNTLQNLLKAMKSIAAKCGLDIKAGPRAVVLENDRTDTYVKELRALPSDAELVIVIVPQRRGDRHGAIKKVCCLERPLASQVVLQKTLGNEKKLQSVVQRILWQIACKLGGQLWGIKIPCMKALMAIGIDVYKGSSAGQVVIGIVCSTNDTFSKYYSDVVIHTSDDYLEELAKRLKTCIEKYKESNSGQVPSTCVVYRDGIIHSGQLSSLTKEAHRVKEALGIITKVAYVAVQRRCNARFFKNAEENPKSGTVVDHSVTEKDWYDFYLVPMDVNMGTVSPTHFTVILDDTETSPDDMQRVAYALTHVYFNWTGNVKVPSPCQYSHKLVELVGEHLLKRPHDDDLKSTLYYL